MVVDTQGYGEAQSSVARALFINPAYTFDVCNEDGSAVADGKQFLQELLEHCLQPQFMLRLRWKVGSLVAWDNIALWHRATTLEMAPSAHRQRRALVPHRPQRVGDLARLAQVVAVPRAPP